MATVDEESWATREMGLILSNMEGLYWEAVKLAKRDETGKVLKEWVDVWFRGELPEDLSKSEKSSIRAAGGQMTIEEYEEIDWESISKDLADE